MSTVILFNYPAGKTTYQITKKCGNKTTITIEKWIADVLQVVLNDVHKYLQSEFYKAQKARPDLGRVQMGNCVRYMAENTANKNQKTKKQVIGWNDDEMLSLL
jgi:hypothetical protein